MQIPFSFNALAKHSQVIKEMWVMVRKCVFPIVFLGVKISRLPSWFSLETLHYLWLLLSPFHVTYLSPLFHGFTKTNSFDQPWCTLCRPEKGQLRLKRGFKKDSSVIWQRYLLIWSSQIWLLFCKSGVCCYCCCLGRAFTTKGCLEMNDSLWNVLWLHFHPLWTAFPLSDTHTLPGGLPGALN